MYIHRLPDWPRFEWNPERLAQPLADIRHRQGRLTGHMEALGFNLRQEAVLSTLTEDVLKSSEIEGERLDAAQVRSSIARRLGVDIGALKPADRTVEGVVEMMLDATRHYDRPLTAERLFGWHASLFPTGRSGMLEIRAGAWRNDRTGPMQVVSGPIGREHVHFKAPPAGRLHQEMRKFLDWFNKPAAMDPVLKAAQAHLWFVTIHPFDDGNGRLARAVADMSLDRSEDSPQRFYSMSAQIRLERAAYYDVLERTQKGTLDITPWMDWFLGCLGRAIDGAQTMLAAVLAKARYWEAIAGVAINERQRRVLNRLLDGFEGKLTTSKYAKLARCSQDTALRDILALVEHGALVRGAEGGRSTSYALAAIPESPAVFPRAQTPPAPGPARRGYASRSR
ncbi:MAG TPA: Fic family protein [Bryobacteraceae bacterium]|nr:Fic family protein [Bryobacteraceae bacterium]